MGIAIALGVLVLIVLGCVGFAAVIRSAQISEYERQHGRQDD